MKKFVASALLLCVVGLSIVLLPVGGMKTARAQSGAALIRSFVKGNLDLQSIGALSFGPNGLLAIADPKAGAIVCIETGDVKKAGPQQARVENLDAVLAAKLGAPAAGIKINDMQVNPASGIAYFSVTAADQKPALMTIDAQGQPQVVSLENVSYGKISLLTKEGVRLSTITDRLARFSKIGGEMVPHGAVEQALQSAAGTEQHIFAVTSVPDDRKGEALAVLHTLDETRIGEVLERMDGAGLPNLFVPRRDHFVHVDQLPLLGTGKLDLKKIRAIALERLSRDL
jgi:hypothetical protein